MLENLIDWLLDGQDGFLEGELLDGRRGVVPSNYVERLVGEDLLEFHQQVVLGVKEPTEDAFSSSFHDYEGPHDESQRLIIGTSSFLPPFTPFHMRLSCSGCHRVVRSP